MQFGLNNGRCTTNVHAVEHHCAVDLMIYTGLLSFTGCEPNTTAETLNSRVADISPVSALLAWQRGSTLMGSGGPVAAHRHMAFVKLARFAGWSTGAMLHTPTSLHGTSKASTRTSEMSQRCTKSEFVIRVMPTLA
ncbi:hypothetical protein Q7P37_009456 [Cladosporium fusiforme]